MCRDPRECPLLDCDVAISLGFGANASYFMNKTVDPAYCATLPFAGHLPGLAPY